MTFGPDTLDMTILKGLNSVKCPCKGATDWIEILTLDQHWGTERLLNRLIYVRMFDEHVMHEYE